MNVRFDAVAREYSTLWDSMEIVRDEKIMAKTVERILASRRAYEEVEAATGVPWYFVGICDMREGGGGAKRHLHNGDSLARPTVQVPAGRPPGRGPFTFKESAIDALKIKGLDKITSWPIERLAYEFERFNGFGYRSKKIDIPSPYLWGGTNHQEPGKYIRDHVFSKSVMDPQHGCMPLLKLICKECSIVIPSMYGATANPAEPSPASNSKAEPEKSNAPVWAGLGVTGITSTAVAVKNDATQLLTGVDLKTSLVPLAIVLAFGAAAFFWGRK